MEENNFVKNSEEKVEEQVKVEVELEGAVESVESEEQETAGGSIHEVDLSKVDELDESEVELIDPVGIAGNKLKALYKKATRVHFEIFNILLGICCGVWAFFSCKGFYLEQIRELKAVYEGVDLSKYPSNFLEEFPFRITMLGMSYVAMVSIFAVVLVRVISLFRKNQKINGALFATVMFAFMGAVFGACMFYFDYAGIF